MSEPWVVQQFVNIGVTVGLGFQGYIIRRLNRLDEKVEGTCTEAAKVKVALVGIDGNNGLTSEVRKLREARHEPTGNEELRELMRTLLERELARSRAEARDQVGIYRPPHER